MYVHNATFQIGNTRWTNQVFLFNIFTNSWDLTYSNNYGATLTDQKQSFVGYWGPVIETHEALNFICHGTNTMGFFQSQVSTTDGAGNPVDLNLLTPTNTKVFSLQGGIQMLFLNPNYDWAVFS